ncbi:MAG: ATP-binding cassette domain-containing protein [Chlorobi bacterium]|nr:ATP-binding cassette domain-containing protein [Chlorobiota bacterium]
MSELLLEALMQLFALLTDVREEKERELARLKVEDFLKTVFNNEYVSASLKLYDSYLEKYHKDSLSGSQSKRKQQESYNIEKLKSICEQLNREMEAEEKLMLITLMLNFIQKENVKKHEEEFVDALSQLLMIDETDYRNLKTFILREPLKVEDKSVILLISGNKKSPYPEIKHIYNRNQQIYVWVIHLKSTNTFIFRYSGSRNLYLNGHKIEQNKAQRLAPGGVIKTSRVNPVYYSTVAEKFIARKGKGRIIYRAIDIEYKFNNNQIGIHKFSFRGRSGQLVGIMGGSGTGKSTLLNVFNGNLKLSSGEIVINGHKFTKDNEALEGVIGYVPQDDLLKEELTVFENLYFNARLCFSHLSKHEVIKLVEQALYDFDLEEARDLVVGTPLNKIISGGQRKRLNIALELIREPSILFVDEPTSGLSSMDSEKVMLLLKRQALKGKLIVIIIHQPSSDIYKLMDKLLIIDKGGRIVYNGNPLDAIVYFKKAAKYVNPEERECQVCGNVKTEQPLRIIEARMVNPSGRLTRKRKVSPEEWYQMYLENFEKKFEWKSMPKLIYKKEKLPPNLYNIPGRLQQFILYTARDALSKLKDRQYMVINLLIAPLLAVILSLFTKYNAGTPDDPMAYIFELNVNIPVYIFMSVIVAIFIGLNISAEEIIKDKRLLQRESFLNLSRFSYLNSKVLILLIISAFQTLSFVLIANSILEIKSTTFIYWLIIFSTAAFANLLGLNISSGLNSVVAIYITIPLIIIPQLLFSGTIVPFQKLHQHLSSKEYVPIVGDMMASRWAYEALAVNQFKNNKYTKNFFYIDKQKSVASFTSGVWVPELKKINEECYDLYKENRGEELRKKAGLLFHELEKLKRSNKDCNLLIQKPFFNRYQIEMYPVIDSILDVVRLRNQKKYSEFVAKKDSAMQALVKKLGSTEALVQLKQKYYNDALGRIVLNSNEFRQVEITDKAIIPLRKPIYMPPGSKWGRAHFYASEKVFAGVTIPTVWFNTIVLWLSTIILYITLYFDVLRKIINYFETFKKRKLYKKLMELAT